MTLNAERVTFTKKKKTVACPVPLAPLADTHAHLLSFWGKEVPETLVRAKAAGVDLLVTMFDPIADKRSVTDYSDWLVREAFAATPLDRILFETDCPYMAPEPIRGLECEPAMISITANALVNDRVDRTGEDAETIAQAAWENACKLFQK